MLILCIKIRQSIILQCFPSLILLLLVAVFSTGRDRFMGHIEQTLFYQDIFAIVMNS